MTYAIISNNAITAHGPARDLWRDTAFTGGTPTPEFLNEQGAVEIRHDPPHDPETHYLQRCEPYLLDGEVFDREVVERPPEPQPVPEPQWQPFQVALLTDPQVHDMMMMAKDAYPGLISAWSTGLGQAATGMGFATFFTAWNLARNLPDGTGQAPLLPQALVEHIVAMAAATDLPAEFIAGLNPAPQEEP